MSVQTVVWIQVLSDWKGMWISIWLVVLKSEIYAYKKISTSISFYRHDTWNPQKLWNKCRPHQAKKDVGTKFIFNQRTLIFMSLINKVENAAFLEKCRPICCNKSCKSELHGTQHAFWKYDLAWNNCELLMNFPMWATCK